jgi:hypothetical protein
MSQYCHVFVSRRGFGLVNLFIGSWLVVTTISSYTLNITVTIAHVTSHIFFWPHYCSLGTSELKSGQFPFPYSLGTDHVQKTQFYCCVAQITQKTSHIITISPIHWHADSSSATSYKHSSYCCVTLSEKAFIAPLPIYTLYNTSVANWTFYPETNWTI